MKKIKLLLVFIAFLFLGNITVNAKMLNETFDKPITFNNGSNLNNYITNDEDLVNRLRAIDFSKVTPEIDIVESEANFYNINDEKYPNGVYGISSTNGNYYNLWYTNYYHNLFKYRKQSYDVKVSVLRVFDESPGMVFVNPNKMSFSLDDPSFEDSNTLNRYHGFELIINIFKSNTTTGSVIPGLFLGINGLNNIVDTNEGVIVKYLEPDKKILMNKNNNNYMYGNDTFYTLDNGDNFNSNIYLTSHNIQYTGTFDITYATNRGNEDISFDFLIKSFKVKYQSEINGSITDIGNEEVYENDYPNGSNVENDNGIFLNWTCNKDVTIDDRTIMRGNPITNDELKQIVVQDDLIFTAHYKSKKYKIITSAKNGDIDLSTEVNIHDTRSISYTPSEGYHLDSITVDGKSIDISKYPTFYTFEDVTENHEINASFSINKYMIKTSVEGGQIDSDKEVSYGDNATISYYPNEGYKLYKVIVDNILVNNPREYDFTNVKENHEIYVVYEKIPTIEVTKKSDKKDYKDGDIVTYNIKLNQTNNGAVARDVIVTDTLNNNLTLDESSLDDNKDIEIIEISNTHFKIKINQIEYVKTITYKAKIKDNIQDNEISNDVFIQIGNLDDTIYANNKVYIPRGEIESKINNSNFYYDDIITFEIKATQKTNGASIHNAIINASLPSELELIKAYSDNADVKINGNTLSCLVKELSNNEITIKVNAKIKTVFGKIRIISTLLGDEISYPIEDHFFINVISPKLYISSSRSVKKAKLNDNIHFYVDISSNNAKEVTFEALIPKGLKLNKKSIKTDGSIDISDNKLTIHYKALNSKKNISYKAKVIDTGTLKTIYSLDSKNNTND